jgi:hypothetical protein
VRAPAVAAAVALLGLLATLPASGKQSPLQVTLAARPGALVAGRAWTATLLVRRNGRPALAKPILGATRGRIARTFATRAAGRGRYHARVTLTAGTWTLAARVGRRSFALGRIAVRAAAITMVGPTGIARAPGGDIVVADRESGRILRFDLATRRLTVVNDELIKPTGLDVDAAGNVWVADDWANAVYRVDPAGRATKVADVPNPLDVAVAPSGDVFVTGRDSRVVRIDSAGVASVYAGTGETGYGGDGGPATEALLNSPHGLAVDAGGHVFLADIYRVRRIDRVTGIITTVAGSGEQGYGGDGGPATAGQLSALRVEALADGSLLVADNDNNRLRRVGADGMLSTVAGTGREEDFKPFDLALAGDGSVIVVQLRPPRIFRVDPASGAVETLVGPR